MPPKKKLPGKSLEGQTQPSFAKRYEESQHQEQEAANAEKDDAKAQPTSTKCKEQRLFEPWLKTYSWLVNETERLTRG